MRCLDLYSGAGGAGMGWHLAGFDVTGVDVEPQPDYPFEFVQGDAIDYLLAHGHEYDLIHASPPCQAYSDLKHAPNARTHPELIASTRQALQTVGRPYVIENVEGARKHLTNPLLLCGSMFGLGIDGYQLRRHRLFEIHPTALPQPRCAHEGRVIGIYGSHIRSRSDFRSGADFPGTNKLGLARQALGIDWMGWHGLSQSIPPAYTQHIGQQLAPLLLCSLYQPDRSVKK